MNEETIIAVLVLCFVFGLLGLAYHKRGIEDLTKIWGLFGPIAGAIVSFYFTAKASDAELQVVNAEKQMITSNYAEALRVAESANKKISNLELYVKNVPNKDKKFELIKVKEADFLNLIDDAKVELKLLEAQRVSLPESIRNDLGEK
ncbi:TPA: hypothetical protein N2965_002367 [Vibrio parahaemolyticus]|nr:hypothetical protein [Vibrio parahaemolyticus]